MADIRFDNQTAVVTGAGRGIGRAHAMLLAERGAHVVVNDIGVAMSGDGGSSSPAAETVAAIKAAGGSAEANTSDVATPDGARQLVEQALAVSGQVHLLVNNAGIYRTDSADALDLDNVRQLHAVHVGGSVNTTAAVWPHMVAARYGRIVMTTSTGSFGAAHLIAYGAAKAGVIGLTRALAVSGIPHSINVNAVAPLAMTRMMNARRGHGAEPPIDPDRDPALVSGLVALLGHADCPSTGEVYLSGMRRYARFVICESAGYLHPDLDVTPEVVRDNWDQVYTIAVPRIVLDTMSWSATNRSAIGLGPLG